MANYLDYEPIKERAETVIKWWQYHKIGEDLSHQTNKLCGNVNYYLTRMESGEYDKRPDNCLKLINRVYEAEQWIRALQYKGDA